MDVLDKVDFKRVRSAFMNPLESERISSFSKSAMLLRALSARMDVALNNSGNWSMSVARFSALPNVFSSRDKLT